MGNKRGGGLFFGVIVGTLLGILFAPRKGKELRKQLKQEVTKGGYGAQTLKQNFTEMGEDIANTAGEVYAQPDVQKVVKKGKKQVGEWMHTAEGHIDKAEQKVKNLGEKYLDINEEKLQGVSKKLHSASKKVQGKIQTFRKKLMGDMGFTKKPLEKSTAGSKKTAEPRAGGKPHPTTFKRRTKRVNIRKK